MRTRSVREGLDRRLGRGGRVGIDPGATRLRHGCRARAHPGLVLAAACALAVATGCEDGGSAGGSRGVSTLLADYSSCRDSEDLERVHESAHAFERDAEGEERVTAAYVAGLTSYRLGTFDEAERHLVIAATAEDERQAALAHASLGLVRLQQGRPADAADLLEQAYPDLPIAEQATAARTTADMHVAAGDLDEAQHWVDLARATPVLVDGGGFALQAGAFRERVRAERAARDTADLPGATAFGGVRILPKSGVGGTYFVVQLGRFATRQDARRARDRLGQIELIVTDAL